MSSASSDLLINDPKYSWLRELGLEADNPGVFDGSWHAQGNVRCCQAVMTHVVYVYGHTVQLQVVTSYSPTSGRPIARVQEVRELISINVV